MTVLYVLLGALAIIAVFLIGIYNSLVSKKQRVNQAFADIDVQLKQRQNLIPNLVETVKGYATHERETLDAVITARNSAVAANSPGEMAQAEGMLTSALGKLFALAEAYPDLKANENFKDLQDELSVIEDKLAAARRFYNAAVQDYNTSREQFPNSIVAGMFNFPEREFFDLGGDRTALSTVPEVKF
ncbi:MULTISPECIES: LemA family protein [Henriciella]|jgi:LemA protein|uniref:Membrane protein n=2 Tax=Henriciella pelagia TaxID=1977912 RepID=A0ABQ1J2N6_9PROT|nr:LemA family protein [Henriciella pelagia]GGB58463.1 membrane protein [Henriciella pelagia]